MSDVMEEEINRWTARRKSALVLEIIQGKTTESARDLGRLRPLRRWSHEQVEQVLI